MTRFIVSPKKKGYAGNGEKIREADDSKTFVFQDENFYYTDNYAGSSQAPGNEIVRWKKGDGQRIWQMSYSGGMLPEFWGDKELMKETFECLKKSLLLIDFEHPFRGPEKYIWNNLKYVSSIKGDIKRFNGKERIIDKRLNEIIFSQEFIGCLVVPKIK